MVVYFSVSLRLMLHLCLNNIAPQIVLAQVAKIDNDVSLSTSKNNRISSLEEIWDLYSKFQLSIPKTGFPGGSDGKESACNTGGLGLIPRSGISPGERMATHSSILTWRILWTEEPGGLQSIGSQRVRPYWSNLIHIHANQRNRSNMESKPAHPCYMNNCLGRARPLAPRL